MPQKGGAIVEEHDVEPCARDLASETRSQFSNQLTAISTRESFVHEDGDIEIALHPGTSPCPAAEEKPETDAGNLRQSVAQALRRRLDVIEAHESTVLQAQDRCKTRRGVPGVLDLKTR